MGKLYSYCLFTLFFSLYVFNSFSQTKAIITGRFEGAVGKEMVYIISDDGIKDSTSISNKKFKFTLNSSKEWDIYFVSCPEISKNFMFPLFLKEGTNINLELNKELKKPIISGDKNAKEQNAFYQKLSDVTKPYLEIEEKMNKSKDPVALLKLKEESGKAEAAINKYYINWVLQHRELPFSVAVIRLFIDKTNVLKSEDSVATKCFDALFPTAKENNKQARLLTKVFSFYNDKYSIIPINQSAPFFTIKDSLGGYLSLNDFKEKWLLIDFWASWCIPCRQNNPLLKKLYYKYKERGLNILSISVDTDEKKWKAAIQKDGMDWNQGSDLLGYHSSGVASKYHIGAVPLYILISPEGIIILKSIGGDIKLIESKLKSILME